MLQQFLKENRRVATFSFLSHYLKEFVLLNNWLFCFAEGRWKVSIVTSELAAAATDSHVTITVYGVKGNTGPILLNGDNKATFKSGSEDQFVVGINIGDPVGRGLRKLKLPKFLNVDIWIH